MRVCLRWFVPVLARERAAARLTHDGRQLARFERRFQLPQVLADRARGIGADQPRKPRTRPARSRLLFQFHADLGTPATPLAEVDGAGGHHIRARQRSPAEHFVLDLVDELRVPLDALPPCASLSIALPW